MPVDSHVTAAAQDSVPSPRPLLACSLFQVSAGFFLVTDVTWHPTFLLGRPRLLLDFRLFGCPCPQTSSGSKNYGFVVYEAFTS